MKSHRMPSVARMSRSLQPSFPPMATLGRVSPLDMGSRFRGVVDATIHSKGGAPDEKLFSRLIVNQRNILNLSVRNCPNVPFKLRCAGSTGTDANFGDDLYSGHAVS